MFVDEARIHVKSGDGGNGAMQFRREKYIPLGGPSGGDGGRGGDVVLVVDTRLNTLSRFHYRTQFNAENGGNGASSNKTGRSADELVIEVPPGTIVRDLNTGELLEDLTQPGQRAVIARGGRGGRGNARFKSSTNQAPRMAERGEPGIERELLLELKVLADVGIVGVPNAGKSTLLSVVTAAKPKIANYPFTTLTPNLGVAEAADCEIVLADIPGLVEGAHQGVGLGHSFLRHIQRTRLLIHLLDGGGEDPIGDFVQINTELALFDPDLAKRPQVVVLNKIDLPQAQAAWGAVKAFVEERGYTAFQISAVAHQGVRDLLNYVAQRLTQLPQVHESEEIPIFKPEDEGETFNIVRENDAYRIVGNRIERAASMTYWEYEEAVVRFYRILEALGVADALRDAGIEAGDNVLIGEYELEWED